MSEKPFSFICGNDDFLVDRLGKAQFAALVGDSQDEFSREVLSGFANNVDEVRAAIYRLRDSVQTVSMFGGGERRVVWFKDVNFLADSVTGRAESTLALLEELKVILSQINPQETALLITAAPVDRRRAFPKWCEKNARFTLIDDKEDGGETALLGIVRSEAEALGVEIAPDAAALLLARIGSNTRLIVEELHKLASFASGEGEEVAARGDAAQAGSGATIEEAHVAELTPNVAEGEFFETAEAFFSGDLKWTLAALRRHFFAGGDARPILAALQNRNRILIQVRALLDAGEARLGRRGLEGLPAAAALHSAKFVGVTEKSSYHLFSQHPFYVGKLAGAGRLPSLRRLIDNQQEFIAAFEETISRPREQEQVLSELATRCLGG
ncbi:DNA polymerase III subunit delta [Cephaloticoccus primus]|uniref:DNA polymerase III subunit delta n=1 Tax=Cephaloticoccus primus TaxID=1548207 RepID=A0A139SKT7_9BACT|nr:DNA polymerase III subunit delta [Cephaloticoccus primus]KXU35165.1 DNA polymerase III subunit delta [Cephaloticoccus primus]